MRPLAAAVALSALLFAAACASTGAAKCADCSTAQSVVESVAKLHPDCLRLTVHCAMEGGAKACASTDAERVGTASEKEDLDAMRSGKTIVLDEAGAIDVTVPINAKDGKFMSTCGATMKVAGMSRDQAVAQATAIAKAVEAGLGGSCACCCK
jgi:hypothetical protein